MSTLLQQIAALLPGSAPTSLTAGSKGEDAYEGYGFAIALAAAIDVGLTVTYEDKSGTAFIPSSTSPVLLRTAPSKITTGNFTHGVLAQGGDEKLEVHTGVYVAGISGAAHECDVAIIKRPAGIACRAGTRPLRASDLVWAFEAKFYDGGKIGIDVGREFLGLNADIGGGSARRTSIYATESVGAVKRLIAHHGRVGSIFTGLGIDPLVEDDLRSHCRGILKKALAA